MIRSYAKIGKGAGCEQWKLANTLRHLRKANHSSHYPRPSLHTSHARHRRHFGRRCPRLGVADVDTFCPLEHWASVPPPTGRFTLGDVTTASEITAGSPRVSLVAKYQLIVLLERLLNF